MNIYIGNLSFDTTEDQLRQAFEQFGEIASINIISDKYTGRSKGFGFVEMGNKTEAIAAINGLNEQDLNGRNMSVNEAKPRPQGGNRQGNNRSRNMY